MLNLENLDILNSTPPLLLGESVEQLERLRAELEQEIKPRGPIERFYVNEVLALILEILRLRRFKTDIIRNARLAALEAILKRLDPRLAARIGLLTKARRLASAWFEETADKEIVADKKFVEELFRKAQLDEGTIDAEAIGLVFQDVRQLDGMLTSKEKQFSKTLRRIAQYRKSWAQQIQTKADRILIGNDLPRLELASDREAG